MVVKMKERLTEEEEEREAMKDWIMNMPMVIKNNMTEE
jgi:hypothetical protein